MRHFREAYSRLISYEGMLCEGMVGGGIGDGIGGDSDAIRGDIRELVVRLLRVVMMLERVYDRDYDIKDIRELRDYFFDKVDYRDSYYGIADVIMIIEDGGELRERYSIYHSYIDTCIGFYKKLYELYVGIYRVLLWYRDRGRVLCYIRDSLSGDRDLEECINSFSR